MIFPVSQNIPLIEAITEYCKENVSTGPVSSIRPYSHQLPFHEVLIHASPTAIMILLQGKTILVMSLIGDTGNYETGYFDNNSDVNRIPTFIAEDEHFQRSIVQESIDYILLQKLNYMFLCVCKYVKYELHVDDGTNVLYTNFIKSLKEMQLE